MTEEYFDKSNFQILGPLEVGKVYDTGIDEIWVTELSGELIAVSNICPHKLGPISEGKIENDCIECPWHGYWFNLLTGECQSSCPKLTTYDIKVEDGQIWVGQKS